MSSQSAIILGVAIALLGSLTMSLIKSRRKQGLNEFFYAGKTLKIWQVVHLLLSGSFAMNGLLYQTFLGFKIGWAAIIMQVIWCISYILISRRAAKIKELTSRGTLHTAIGNAFGLTAGKLAAIATLIGFTIQIGWELIVGVSVFGNSFTNNPNYSIWLIIAIILICITYTISGGLRGSAWTNVFQNWVSIVAILILCGFLIHGYNPTSLGRPWDSGSFGRLISELGISFFITNALFSIFWQFVDFSTWQDLGSGEGDQKQAKSTLYWSSLWVFIFPGVVGTVAGMYLRGTAGIDPNNLFPHIIGLISHNTFLLVLVVTGCVTAMLSTIDGFLLATSQVAVWDLFFANKVKRANDDHDSDTQHKLTNYGRAFILLFGLIGSILIYYITTAYKIDIFSLVYLVTIAQMILVPIVLLLLFSKSPSNFKFGSLSIGLGLITGLVIVCYGIATGNQDVLAWSPTICLVVSCIPQTYNLLTPKTV